MSVVLLQANDTDIPVKISKSDISISSTIQNMINDFGEDSNVPIPLNNVDSKTLEKIVEYCEHYGTLPKKDTNDVKEERREMTEWDKQFVVMDQKFLFNLILAANYLDIKPLLDLTCKQVANMIKGKTPEEIRVTFNIKNDFTPEEEEKVRKENEWCEER